MQFLKIGAVNIYWKIYLHLNGLIKIVVTTLLKVYIFWNLILEKYEL